jgi:hypothetical protein
MIATALEQAGFLDAAPVENLRRLRSTVSLAELATTMLLNHVELFSSTRLHFHAPLDIF